MHRARTLTTLVVAGTLAACGTLNPSGDIPKNSTLIADANLRISPNYSITVEKIVYGAAGAALLYYLYDPLAPNWDSREEVIAEDTYRLSMQMKRFHIGGDGEWAHLMRRWAEALQQENGASAYRIVAMSEGIDSSTPIARRYAEATVRLLREQPASPVSLETAPFPSPATTVRRPGDVTPVGADESPAASVAQPTGDAGPGKPEARQRALPRPLPAESIDRSLLRLRLDARALFAFDKSVLTPEGRAVLDREVVARRDELGAVSVLIVSGHADRIGTYEYNQRLSAARAQAVRSHLLRQGFPAHAIRTEAFGEQRPLASVVCDESMPRAALIDCLAPNRRVEVRRDEGPR